MNKVGSSPCVWGQAYLGYVWHPQIRIIPMRVGTSKHVCYYQLTAQDHPHACGDKRPKRFIVSVGGGSSPCVWGQAANPTAYIILMRIIPMRVGTRIVALQADDLSWDHPHACGDKRPRRTRAPLVSGSSPCVWGQVNFHLLHLLAFRIIPMRVGTRLKKSRKIAVLQNQPLRFPLTFHRSFV